MILVVDASVATKWFVRENLHEQALLLLSDHADDLQAPDFILTEVTNIAWKKALRNEISQEQARVIPTELRGYILSFHPSADLVDGALDIALSLHHPVYDCLYIACAEAIGGVLITADKKLHKAIEGTDFERLVRYLGDPGFSA